MPFLHINNSSRAGRLFEDATVQAFWLGVNALLNKSEDLEHCLSLLYFGHQLKHRNDHRESSLSQPENPASTLLRSRSVTFSSLFEVVGYFLPSLSAPNSNLRFGYVRPP